MTVPTWANAAVATGGVAIASIANTSVSGSVSRIAFRQSRPTGSSQPPVAGSNLTISPTSGPGTPSTFAVGAGRPPGIGRPSTSQVAAGPPSHTEPSATIVVWLPDWNEAA